MAAKNKEKEITIPETVTETVPTTVPQLFKTIGVVEATPGKWCLMEVTLTKNDKGDLELYGPVTITQDNFRSLIIDQFKIKAANLFMND